MTYFETYIYINNIVVDALKAKGQEHNIKPDGEGNLVVNLTDDSQFAEDKE
jgi:hypothetical protein